ncbi:HalOD1 output domain-containing protein [Haloparvum sedimenti]|uniref:HalOD1 output domain-containing protein n=1 Tax=Haloparvum sedimenti TaxID=1678448 RepID=UPI0009B5B759|nr:HalOD1 output domain-containing protein [Haloparvum sedimenti]
MDPRETACERVTRRVAEETDVDALDLPPLFDAVDPDALNALVASMETGEITFAYAGRSVTVTADGAVRVAHDIRSPSGAVGGVAESQVH